VAEPTQELDARVRLTEELWNDPETRPLIEQAVVKKYPKAVQHVPGVAIRQESEKVLAEATKIKEDTLAIKLEMERKDALERARREIMDDPLLQIREDEIAAVESLMTDEKEGLIGSHKRAAQLYRAQQAVASSQTAGGVYSTMQIPGVEGAGGDDYKWLAPGVGKSQVLDQVTRKRAEEIINDFRAGRVAKWLG
jgi:hypothetical protein